MKTATRPGPAAWIQRAGTAATLARLALPYTAFAVLKHLVPTARLARWAWTRPAGHRDPAREARVIGCVVRLRRLAGGAGGDCLQGSLVLYRELSRAGADPRLLMGFGRNQGRLEGHAWVTVNGRPVAEQPAATERFVVAVRFGRNGRPLDPSE